MKQETHFQAFRVSRANETPKVKRYVSLFQVTAETPLGVTFSGPVFTCSMIARLSYWQCNLQAAELPGWEVKLWRADFPLQ